MAQTSTQTSAETDRLEELMFHDHRHIEQLLSELVEASRAGAQDDVRRLWASLEQELTRHFDLEEREIFPRFARIDPEEAARLTSDHAALRQLLADLGNGVDLHTTGAGTIQAFRERLRDHATREGLEAYRWAGQSLPPSKREELVQMVRDAVRRFKSVML